MSEWTGNCVPRNPTFCSSDKCPWNDLILIWFDMFLILHFLRTTKIYPIFPRNMTLLGVVSRRFSMQRKPGKGSVFVSTNEYQFQIYSKCGYSNFCNYFWDGGRVLVMGYEQYHSNSRAYEKLLSWNMRKKSVADDTTFWRSVDLWVNHARLRRGWSSPLWSMGVIVLCDSEEWLFNPESNGILVVDSCIAMFYLLGISQSACNFNRNV